MKKKHMIPLTSKNVEVHADAWRNRRECV